MNFELADARRLHLPSALPAPEGYAEGVVGAKGNRTPDLSHVIGALCH